MEHVFFARHGDYDQLDGNLTDKGIDQITGLAKQIKLILADQSNPLILTSQARRAMESSEILKVTLSTRVPEQCPYINNISLSDADIANIDSWIDRAASLPEPLILVTHLPVLEKYIPHFAVKYLGRSKGEKWEELPKGGAYHFDLITKTVQKLPNSQTRMSLDSRVLEGNEDEINAALQLASQERVFLTDADWLYLRNTESQPAERPTLAEPSPPQPKTQTTILSPPAPSLERPSAPLAEPQPAISPIAPPLSQSVPIYSIARQAELKKTVYQFVLLADSPFDRKHFVSFLRTNLGEKEAIDETKHNYFFVSGAHDATLSFMTVMDPYRQTLLVSSHNLHGINATKALIEKAIGSQPSKK